MTQWSEYESYTGIVRLLTVLLILLLAFALQGCAQSLSRPVTASPPPSVPCKVDQMPNLPEIHELSGMDEWALQVMGIVEAQAVKINANTVCMANLRKRGVIQ